MRTATHIGVLLSLLVCAASGCRLFNSHASSFAAGHSPLRPAQASVDSVAMEIIWARFPANDPVLDDAAWREIDETQIDPAVRRELVNNGLRAGVISGATPPAIAKVLHEDASPQDPGRPQHAQAKAAAEPQMSELINEPIVHGRKCQLRRNQRSEIQASEVYPTLPLLVSGDTELGGRPYAQAQAIYALRVDPQQDRTVMVELTPEVHHGQPQLRYTSGEEGFLRQAPLRDRVVFDRLRLNVKLAPGEMLVLASLPDAGSRLGHYFHTVDSTDGLQQKLMLVRLAEVPPSDTFTDNGK